MVAGVLKEEGQLGHAEEQERGYGWMGASKTYEGLLQVTVQSEPSRLGELEERSLNMKGRRLEPLEIRDVKIVLRPAVKGRFGLTPQTLCLDDSSRYTFCEPVGATVKELGLRIDQGLGGGVC